MNWWRRKVFLAACRIATKNEIPSRYSVGRKENNFTFFKFFEAGEENSRFLLLKPPLGEKLNGISWPNNLQEGVETDVQIDNIFDPIFEIRRVYGSVEITYSSPISFLLAEKIKYHRLIDFKRRVELYFFKRTFRFTHERMKVLEAVVDWRRSLLAPQNNQHIEDRFFTHIDLYTKMYGWNAWHLDDYQAHLEQLRFILLSFVESGELDHGVEGFKLRAKSLETLSVYEEQAQKHMDAHRQSKGIFWLTLVIAVSAIGQLVWNIYSDN